MRLLVFLLFTFIFSSAISQNERKMARKGNAYYEDSLFLESEIQYRKSLLKNNSSNNIKFNLSDAIFKQDRYDESITLLNEVISNTSDSVLKSESYYNLGNNLLKQQKLEDAIEAYKNCLRINPTDEEARYNLSKSISLLEKQNQNNYLGKVNNIH